MSSAGASDSGPVAISGAQNASGVQRLEVRAFGRTVRLQPAELAVLKGFTVTAVDLEYENTIPKFGGPQVYIRLQLSGKATGRAALLVVNNIGAFRLNVVKQPPPNNSSKPTPLRGAA
jgi:hypothetical protein